jgi:hypothetical protein
MMGLGNNGTHKEKHRHYEDDDLPWVHVGSVARQLVKHLVGVEKLGSKTRFPSGEFLPIRVFLLLVVADALAIAGCALMLRNRTSRFRFWATAAR